MMAGVTSGRAPRRLRVKSALGVIIAIALCSVGIAACQGCSNWIAHAIVDAPNADKSVAEFRATPSETLEALGIGRELRVDVGPPAAELSIWIIEPSPSGSPIPVVENPKGTILVLHGIRDGKKSQVDMGRQLAAAGYCAVLVDLRGHGQSTGQWLTYGAVESHDLVQVLDALERERILTGRVGVFGASYGGAVGIQLAAIDPRVKAVVAVATFASLKDIVPEYVDSLGFGWLVSDQAITNGVQLAGAIASFDPSQASPIDAITHVDAQVLLIHGKNDQHIRFEHSERLHQAAPSRSRLILLEGVDHVTIMKDESGVIMRESLAMFDDALKSNAAQ